MRRAQLDDQDIKPILEWMEKSPDRPLWSEIAPHSQVAKVYWAQWQSLKIVGGVLYRLWETPSGDAVIQHLVLPESLRAEVLRELHDT